MAEISAEKLSGRTLVNINTGGTVSGRRLGDSRPGASHTSENADESAVLYRLNMNMNIMLPEVPDFFLWHLVLLLDESFVGFSVDHQGVLVCESAHWVNFDDARRAALPHLECLGSDQLEHPVVAEHLFAINS